MVVRCGHNILKNIFEKRVITEEKSIPSSSIVKKSLPKNPYCSSITGTFAFNLSKISFSTLSGSLPEPNRRIYSVNDFL